MPSRIDRKHILDAAKTKGCSSWQIQKFIWNSKITIKSQDNERALWDLLGPQSNKNIKKIIKY